MKILAVTGIRSEYDILFPVIDLLRNRKAEVNVLVSGAHLSEHFGMTQSKIQDDNFVIVDRIDNLLSTDRVVQRAKGVGMLIQGLSQTVERVEPDIMLVVGDREEAIAAAIVGNYMETILVHIGGGDSAFGDTDGPTRFAVSKLAHVHCVNHQEYANNLLKLGEEKFRIFNTGNPAYSNMERVLPIELTDLFAELKIPTKHKDYIVFIQHPLSSELKETEKHTQINFRALEKFCIDHDYIAVCISPNSDPGSEIIRKNIQNNKSKEWFYPLETLTRDNFVNLMRYAKALVGNSSMGLLEAPHYKLPAVNIGQRQRGRLNAGNVVFVKNDISQIVSEIEKACLDKSYRKRIQKLKNPYGDETAAEKIVDVIYSIDIQDPKWHLKKPLGGSEEIDKKTSAKKFDNPIPKVVKDPLPIRRSSKKVVLCIAPHPDDETLGCGGSLLRHKAEGDDVHWMIMTTIEGNDDYSDERKKERAEEILKVSKTFDFTSVHQCAFLATHLDNIPLNEVIGELIEYLRKIKPEIIYLPFSGDIHTDHRVVFEAVASSTKSFRHPYIKTMRCYETLSETEFNLDPEKDTFRPNLWVDIDDYLDEKVRIMNIYKGEMSEPPFPRSEENIRALAIYRGSAANFHHAEAFLVLKELI